MKAINTRNDDNDLNSDLECRYWLAVNGASVAACSMPLPAYPTVSPTPQVLIGFPTREEQLKCQRFLLTGRQDKVRRFVTCTLPKLAGEGKVIVKRLRYPEPPTYGPTLWGI